MQLVNRIIYRNIYGDPEETSSDLCQQPQASDSIRKGDLLLHRGGLASFKWVRYDCVLVQLQYGGTAMRARTRHMCQRADEK